MNYKIPFSPPDISDLDIRAVTEVLKSGWITTGSRTKQFESEIARYCGTSKAACLNSATACLELTLRILGIGPGDEVITSAYTYTASCSVMCHVGATPVLVDTAENSLEMDYNKLERAITEKTKAIIPVDIAGIMCDYNKIFEILESKKNVFKPTSKIQESIGRVAVIADAAHSFGAWQKNGEKIQKSGSVADFSCFSFHAVKNLTTCEGGAVTWREVEGVSNEEIYRNYMLWSLHGQTKDAFTKSQLGAWEYDIEMPGYKCNMTDMFAVLGLSQLSRYESLLARRKEIVKMYDEGLKSEQIWTALHLTENSESSPHLYLTKLIGKNENFRNQFIAKMAEKGICTNVHYKPLPLLTAYKNLGFKIDDFPNAFKMYENEVTLPLHTLLKDDEIEYVIQEYKKLAY